MIRFFYPVNIIMQALLDATQNLQTTERERLYERLLSKEEPIELIPPSSFKEDEYREFAQERLERFRRILFQELRRQAKQARRESRF
ncbi:hypothetical protein HYV57_05230 [Candidatus Peregrinibacteria bacterium]|nr:hypothetical protein [Candidatus Peregrinibacteria bacterium]